MCLSSNISSHHFHKARCFLVVVVAVAAAAGHPELHPKDRSP